VELKVGGGVSIMIIEENKRGGVDYGDDAS
jgi:hypothetical protein